MAATCSRIEARAARSTAFGSLSRISSHFASVQPFGR